MMEGVLTNLSTERAEKVIDEIYDHVTVQVRPNSLRVIGGLILACSNTYPTYTLKKFLPLCIPRIKTELSFGAASSRTTTTTVPVASDAALHWHMVLLLGAVSGASFEMLQYKEELVSLFHILIDKTYAEISYSWAARIIEKVISGMMRIFAMEGRLVNPDVWESEDFKYNHHLYWGKTYRLADIKIDWHIPSQPEIDFVIELTRMISPLMDKLENLLAEPSQSLEWNNDFCRYISYVKYTIAAVAQAWEESPADKTGGEEHRSLP
jgi:proteasome activator subunit 4